MKEEIKNLYIAYQSIFYYNIFGPVDTHEKKREIKIATTTWNEIQRKRRNSIQKKEQ